VILGAIFIFNSNHPRCESRAAITPPQLEARSKAIEGE
jgi:hypothetical protein